MFNKRTPILDTLKFFQDSNSLFGFLREDKTCLILLKTLSDIAFEQITGNYWYAAYGPFDVIMMKDTGYINATKLCSSGGKDYCDWKCLKSNQELINALEGHKALENMQSSLLSDN